MLGRSGVMMLVAIVCGLGAMFGVRQLLARNEAKPDVVEILAASRDIQVEEVLRPEMIKVIEVPADGAPAGSYSSYKDVEERWVRIPLLANEPIIDAKLAAKGTPTGLLAKIPEGMRGYTIEVNEESGVSGFVLPEHRVDVILARDRNRAGRLGTNAQTILQNVLVLASGTAVTRPDDPSIQARTVTLAVTPQQIDTLAAARTEGSLSLSLRGHEDHAIVEVSEEPEPAEAEPPAWQGHMDEILERLRSSEAKLTSLELNPPAPPLPPPPPAATPEPIPVRTLRGSQEGLVRIHYLSPMRSPSPAVAAAEPPSPGVSPDPRPPGDGPDAAAGDAMSVNGTSSTTGSRSETPQHDIEAPDEAP